MPNRKYHKSSLNLISDICNLSKTVVFKITFRTNNLFSTQRTQKNCNESLFQTKSYFRIRILKQNLRVAHTSLVSWVDTFPCVTLSCSHFLVVWSTDTFPSVSLSCSHFLCVWSTDTFPCVTQSYPHFLCVLSTDTFPCVTLSCSHFLCMLSTVVQPFSLVLLWVAHTSSVCWV